MKNRIKRIIAIIIDIDIVPTIPLYIIYISTQKITNTNILNIISLIEIIIMFTLIFCKDIILKKYSIGKRLLKLKIVDNDNNPVTDKKLLVKRNICSLLYLAFNIPTLLFSNKTFGDINYNTKVIVDK